MQFLSQRRLTRTMTCLAICLAVPRLGIGQTAENVAVIVNTNSAESQRIADHYARVRGLPESNVIRIQASTDDAIERDAYVKTIEQPIGLAIRRAGLQDRLLYLVLTKGIPLRIVGTTGSAGTSASVDSELTLLYRRLAGQPVSLQGRSTTRTILRAGILLTRGPSHIANTTFISSRGSTRLRSSRR